MILISNKINPALFSGGKLVMVLKLLLSISVMSQLHYMVNIVIEVSNTLNIRVFLVKDKVVTEDDFERAMEV